MKAIITRHRLLLLSFILCVILLAACAVQYSFKSSPRSLYLTGLIITAVFLFVILRSLKRSRAGVDGHQQAVTDINSTPLPQNSDEFLRTLPGIPARFSFHELQSMTENFSHRLGKGGSGSVFHGKLCDGTDVAVKRLEREGLSSHSEFFAEVAVISRIRHVNLVSLKGFCAEGSHRLLVYELMPKGSLEKWIYSPREGSHNIVLNWDTRARIALETARALAYLHEECEETILHLDVKPQNILLDDKFRVKVSDFGLSRSMGKDESRIVTTMRGTPGYLAPEWLSGAGIDNKTDVYSFGMVLLELVCGRRCVIRSQADGDSEYWFLPALVFKKLEQNLLIDIVDPLLMIGEMAGNEQSRANAMICIALWCIQEDPSARPVMSNVVHMLEGNVKVMKPPMSLPFISRKHRPDLWDAIMSTTIPSDQTLTFPR